MPWLRATIYASGNFAKNLVWGASELALLFVLTKLYGFSPAFAGALLLVSLIWDACADPWIGALADRSANFGRLILLGAPLLAVSFALLFAGPWLGLTHPAFVGLSLIAFRTGYSLVDVPHNALLARISDVTQRRAQIALLRFLFSSFAALALGQSLPAQLDGAQVLEGPLAVWGALTGLVAGLIIVGAWFAVRRHDRAPSPPPQPIVARTALTILGLPHVRLVFALALVGALFSPLLPKMLLYYADGVLNDVGAAQGALSAMAIGQIAAVPFWFWLSSRWAPESSLGLAHMIAGLSGAALLTGVAQAGASLSWLAGLYGLGASGIYAVIWPLVARAADEATAASGQPSSALVFGATIFLMQLGAGLGTGAMGLCLSAAGWQDGAAQSPAAQSMIGLIAGAGPLLGAAVAIPLCLRLQDKGR